MFKGLFRKKKSQQEQKLDLYISDMKLYLENNYKDLAIKARKDAVNYMEQMYSEKQIEEKSYKEYKSVLDKYTEEMKDYNHQQFYRS